MNKMLTILADIDPQDLLDAHKQFMNSKIYGTVAMFVAVTLAVIVGAIWAILYSQKRKKRPHRHHQKERPGYVSSTQTTVEESEDEIKVRKKWRRQRRPHRPLNPTLAQTKGLPPVRDENTPPPLP